MARVGDAGRSERPRARRRGIWPSGHRALPLRRARRARGVRRSPDVAPTSWWDSSPGAPSRRRWWASPRASPTWRVSRLRCTRSPGVPVPRPAVPAGSVALANGRAAVYPTRRRGVGTSSDAPAWRSSPPIGRPMPSCRRGPGPFTRGRTRRSARTTGRSDHRRGLHPAGRGRCSRWWRPGCAPWSKTVAADMVAAAGIPTAGPADPVSFDVANRLLNNAPGRGNGGADRRGGPRSAPGCSATWPSWAPRPTSGGRDRRDRRACPPAASGPGAPRRAAAPGAGPTVAVAGGILGPTVFGSCASDELTGSAPACSGRRAAALGRPVGGRRSATTCGRGGYRSRRRGAGGAARRTRAPPRAVRGRRARPRLAGLSSGWSRRATGLGSDCVPRRRARPPSCASGASRQRPRLSRGGDWDGAVPPERPTRSILSRDHATLGRVPGAGGRGQADLGRLGQCGPGTRVRLVPVDPTAALEAASAVARALDAAVLGRYPLAVG